MQTALFNATASFFGLLGLAPAYGTDGLHTNRHSGSNRYGDRVGMFGPSKQEKDLKVWAYGLEYTPVPAVTAYVNQRQTEQGRADTEFGLRFTYNFGMDALLLAAGDTSLTFTRDALGLGPKASGTLTGPSTLHNTGMGTIALTGAKPDTSIGWTVDSNGSLSNTSTKTDNDDKGTATLTATVTFGAGPLAVFKQFAPDRCRAL